MRTVLVYLLLTAVSSVRGLSQSLFLNQAGDVGIGTRNPLARLSVSTTGENAIRVDGVNPYMLFRDVNDANPNDPAREYGFIRAWTTNPFNPAGYYGLEIGVPPSPSGQQPKHLLFSTNYLPRMVILANGRVGIGTTSPTTDFEVSGNSQFNGIITHRGQFSVSNNFSIPTAAFHNTSTGKALYAYTTDGGLSGEFEGGRILVTGNDNTARSGGIQFRNNFTQPSLGYVGMNGDTEMGFFGYGLGNWIMRLNVNTGTICTSQAIAVCSDQRLKRDFRPLTGSLAKLAGIQGHHYFWKEAKMPGLQTGFIAQQVQAIFPELVRTDDNGFLSVDYTSFVPHLVESVKELKAKNEALNQQLQIIVQRLSALESRSEPLSNQSIRTTK